MQMLSVKNCVVEGFDEGTIFLLGAVCHHRSPSPYDSNHYFPTPSLPFTIEIIISINDDNDG